MSDSINDASNDAIQFIVKHGDLTRSAAYDAIKLLTGNGFAVTRADLTPPAADYVAGLEAAAALCDGFAANHKRFSETPGTHWENATLDNNRAVTAEYLATSIRALAARPASPDTRVVTPQEAAQVLYDTMNTNRPIFDAMVEAAEDIHATGVSFNRVVADALCAAIAWNGGQGRG